MCVAHSAASDSTPDAIGLAREDVLPLEQKRDRGLQHTHLVLEKIQRGEGMVEVRKMTASEELLNIEAAEDAGRRGEDPLLGSFCKLLT